MQAPYVVQTIIEQGIANSLALLPDWLDPVCHLSLKKYTCGSAMLQPQHFIMLNSLIANNYNALSLAKLEGGLAYRYNVNVTQFLKLNFYLPSYPSYAVCTDYAKNCASFIVAAGLPALVPQCNANSSIGIRNYPTNTQTIASLPIPPSLPLPAVKFQTTPNAMGNSSENYQASCPPG